jgi:hypothetical protein
VRIQEWLAMFLVTPRILAARRCQTSIGNFLIFSLRVIAAAAHLLANAPKSSIARKTSLSLGPVSGIK